MRYWPLLSFFFSFLLIQGISPLMGSWLVDMLLPLTVVPFFLVNLSNNPKPKRVQGFKLPGWCRRAFFCESVSKWSLIDWWNWINCILFVSKRKSREWGLERRATTKTGSCRETYTDRSNTTAYFTSSVWWWGSSEPLERSIKSFCWQETFVRQWQNEMVTQWRRSPSRDRRHFHFWKPHCTTLGCSMTTTTSPKLFSTTPQKLLRSVSSCYKLIIRFL